VRVAADGPLYLCTRANVNHYHASSGRPSRFRYGWMVVRNGWFVWRRRWPHPTLAGRARWWATTGLLTACQFGEVVRGPRRWQQFTEALGRVSGMTTVLFNESKDLSEQSKVLRQASCGRSH
jgi:GT2 family glycosyltransferase